MNIWYTFDCDVKLEFAELTLLLTLANVTHCWWQATLYSAVFIPKLFVNGQKEHHVISIHLLASSITPCLVKLLTPKLDPDFNSAFILYTNQCFIGVPKL